MNECKIDVQFSFFRSDLIPIAEFGYLPISIVIPKPEIYFLNYYHY